MANPSKQKGTAWETAVVRFLQQWWPHAERRALKGAKDQGDLLGLPGVVVECKNQNRLALGEWLDQTTAAQANAGAEVSVLVVKRRGKPNPEDAFWVFPGPVAVALLREWTR